MRQSKSRNLENDVYSFFFNFLLRITESQASGRDDGFLAVRNGFFVSKTFYCYHSQRPVRIRRPPRGKKKKSTSSLCIESIGSVIFRRISNGIKSGKEKKLKHLAYIPDITDRCN